MHALDLVRLFTDRLDAAGAPYVVTGSVACTVFGEPRMTHDVDLVVELAPHVAQRLEGAFPPAEYYCPPEEVIRIEAGRGQRGHFNIIHHQTGYKADIYVRGNDPLHGWALRHPVVVDVGGAIIRFARPEYIILRKLEYFREGGSEKHLRDIRGVLEVSGPTLDVSLMESWVTRMGLQEQWAFAQR